MNPLPPSVVIVIPDDYPTIQEAINAALSGSIIFVKSGIYYEEIFVTKPVIWLIGENRETTIIDGQGETGVWIGGERVLFSNFTIRNSYRGIVAHLWGWWGLNPGARYATITANKIINNIYGIEVECLDRFFEGYISIVGNEIANNSFGLLLKGSQSNRIYHNNFRGNAYQVRSYESVNVWDNSYPHGGNYWSDYTGVDSHSGPYQNETGSDSIGDTQYSIDSDNVDRYPLMHPWSPKPVKVFDVVYEDVHYPVSISSNSSITHFIFNQSLAQISFKLTGDAGKTGYCNITIPKSLMKGPWSYTFEGNVLDMEIFEDANETHTILSFAYKHASTFKITIQAAWVIPEFPHTTTLPFIIITSTLAILLKRRKQKSKRC